MRLQTRYTKGQEAWIQVHYDHIHYKRILGERFSVS